MYTALCNKDVDIKLNAVKNGQSRETGNIGLGTQDGDEQNITQHNMCWTPLCANTHK